MGKKGQKSAAKQSASPKNKIKTKSNNKISWLKKLVEVLQGRISSLEYKVITHLKKLIDN